MSILVITTGGTIGALPYPNPANPPPIKSMPESGVDLVRDSVMKDFPDAITRCISLESKDSNHIDGLYREKMLKFISVAPERAALITHGTDTLLKTAEYLYIKRLTVPLLADRHILLTGSMVPLANGPQSDGYLNLKFSIEQLNALAADKNGGIFIVLCDYDEPEMGKGAWKPRLYPYAPGRYEKVYTKDGRYNHLKRVK